MDFQSGDQPNVLLVVLDACRADYADEYAPFLTKLGESNLTFENAIAPAPWSLPSHGSLFTGEPPHEHGMEKMNDAMEHDLVSRLSERGYATYGVSSNGFASQRTGFHEPFDEFYYSGGRDPFTEGLDVSGTAQDVLREEDATRADAYGEVLRRLPREDHRIKSLFNLFAVGCGEVLRHVDTLERIPHPLFAPDSGYYYDSRRTTAKLDDVLASADRPFFAFTNIMDTHYPYSPDSERQRKYLGESLSYRELCRINESVASSWEFQSSLARGELSEDDVETVRNLYAGEVDRIDHQLERLFDELERRGQLDDTLVVVTGDHGENLGERDDMGRRRMGHQSSVSDAVLRVPLVIAHPDLDARRVEDPVSLADLYHVLVDDVEQLLETGGADLGALEPGDPVISQYPATGGGELLEQYAGIDDEIRYSAEVDTVVGYASDWKVVASSNGERWARRGDEVAAFEDAPSELREQCLDHLSALAERGDADFSDHDVAQLEALGYM